MRCMYQSATADMPLYGPASQTTGRHHRGEFFVVKRLGTLLCMVVETEEEWDALVNLRRQGVCSQVQVLLYGLGWP